MDGRIVRRAVVLGNSGGLIVRPPGDGLPYPRLLELLLNERATDELWLVENLSEVIGVVDDLARLMGRVVAMQPDAIVLKYGRVEAVPRPHGRRIWRWTYMRRPGVSPVRRVLRRLLLRPYSWLRARLGLRRQWTPLPRFRRILDEGLAELRRETRAAIFVVEANPVGRRVEEYGPGSITALRRYNDAARELARVHGAEYVELDEVRRVDPELADIDRLLPDGTHLSAQAHAAVAQVLAARIEAALEVREPVARPAR